ncbi:hypothetical protein B296_00027634 [Ensete ventricosum]|uniref:Uncharacterized protein n=1 Tax=Ensete ventricosum TaxID=4639 RepID=A0A426YS35_ENSVE|nr:hypothetical protein B296_00027634 [Ensete ventricosum]
MRYGCNVNEDNASIRRFNLHEETLHSSTIWDLRPMSSIILRGFGLLFFILPATQIDQACCSG